jgi:hypothetical protein
LDSRTRQTSFCCRTSAPGGAKQNAPEVRGV